MLLSQPPPIILPLGSPKCQRKPPPLPPHRTRNNPKRQKISGTHQSLHKPASEKSSCGPVFGPHFGTPKYSQNIAFLRVPTWPKPNKYFVETTFSIFSWGSIFQPPFHSFRTSLWHSVWIHFGPENAPRPPRAVPETPRGTMESLTWPDTF